MERLSYLPLAILLVSSLLYFKPPPFIFYSHSEQLPTPVSFLKLLAENGTKECHHVNTTHAQLFGLPRPHRGQEITLSTGTLHRLWIVSYDSNGSRRCGGGDFYETDLTGPNWKSRPTFTDLGDGCYQVGLRVDAAFSGIYTLKIILLFTNLHGLDSEPKQWGPVKEMFNLRIRFRSKRQHLAPVHLPTCTSESFKSLPKWTGRWTRTKFNESCELNKLGRYRCFADENEKCDPELCDGALASLESNGWVYSAHCKFRIWTRDEAWSCLSGKKLLFWGDSNHQDTIRNLMNFVLGMKQSYVERKFIRNVTNPLNPSQVIRFFSLFNGHTITEQNNLGLLTLYDEEYRSFITRNFFEGGEPDAVVLNSGLHDGGHAKRYGEAAATASTFWEGLVRNSSSKPRVVFRTTITPGHQARNKPANPAKMEALNHILEEEFRRRLGDLQLQVIDAYDMTFPWHFDSCCSDGGHYGRPPTLTPWYGRIGHFYFIDIMLVHILLTSICN